MRRLSDIVEIMGGGTPNTQQDEFWNGDIPWLSVVDFNNDSRWVSKTEKHITKAGLENSSTKLLQKDDLIISARGTVGALAQLSRPMAFNQSCYGLRAKKDVVDAGYLYYLVKSKVNQITRRAHGAVFDTITRNTFDHILVNLPSIEEQRRIAAVLTSLDDKIELLQKQNRLLEELVQALFKRWFVDFEFPDADGQPYRSSGGVMVESELGEIPERWGTGTIFDVLEIRYGFPFKSHFFNSSAKGMPLIRIRDIKYGGVSIFTTESFLDEYIVNTGDVIAGMDAEFRPALWSGGTALLNQRVCLIRAKGVESANLFALNYATPTFKFFEKTKSGTTVAHLTVSDLKSLTCIVPNIEVVKVFACVTHQLAERQSTNFTLTRRLVELRNLLQNKLLS